MANIPAGNEYSCVEDKGSNVHEENVSLKEQIQAIVNRGELFCSVEYLPPKCQEDLPKVLHCAKQIDSACNVLYRSITCHLNATNKNDPPNLRLANALSRQRNTLLHVTAGGLTKNELKNVLELAKSSGIRSIFALRGGIQQNANTSLDFPHAVDVVKFLRENYGNYFTVCVAGYTTKHPEAESYELDLLHLKEKVEAGADFIITQVILEAAIFMTFVNDCRNLGIKVPIIPGIMPLQTYSSLQQLASICQFSIPTSVLQDLEAIKLDDKAVKSYFIDLIVQIMRKLFSSKTTSGIHVFSLNSETMPIEIFQQLGFGC